MPYRPTLIDMFGKDQWTNLKCRGYGESIHEMKGKVTTLRRYYLTSLKLTTIADTIQVHWSIRRK